jgi:hypothetical protein
VRFSHDGHWRAAGHRIATAALVEPITAVLGGIAPN